MEAPDAEDVRRGDRRALARAMNLLESSRAEHREAAGALVDEVAFTPREGGHVVGLTGPPGVGKSTLAGRLIQAWRERERTVGVVAVDPTSRLSGGALLGDRARMGRTRRDEGVFVRSMAARDRLGGLAPATFDAVLVMRAALERVLVETVGVGQSETDVSSVADTTVVIVQPASGDTLQFLKAGLMEVPDLLVVNKADLGTPARRTAKELRRSLPTLGRGDVPVLQVSASSSEGVEALLEALDEHRRTLAPDLAARRDRRLRAHVVRLYRELYGSLALDALGGERGALGRLSALPVGTPPGTLLGALNRP
ncbi:MAG: ArgK/MeaB family GTPase [Myxococcota bacterium]